MNNNNYEKGYFSAKNEVLTTLKPHLLRTYLFINSLDFDGTGVWYSQENLSKMLGICTRSLQRHIAELKRLNFLSVKRRGFNKTNLMKCLKSIVSKVKDKKEEMANNFKKNFSKNKNKLKFDNFTGRGADYYSNPDLERQLLGWE